MEILTILCAAVNSPSVLFLMSAMAYFCWISRFLVKSKVQELIGLNDLATETREKSRALCTRHAKPVMAAWQSLRHARRQTFPQNLAQVGAVGRDLSQGRSQDRQPPRSGRQGHGGRGQKKAPSSNDDGGDGGGEPPHCLGGLEPLLNYEDFGLVARLAPGTVKNLYCRSPESLPPAIHIPGHRGPLWHPDDVVLWFDQHRSTPTAPPVTPAPKRKAGRPRIAAGKGGAA